MIDVIGYFLIEPFPHVTKPSNLNLYSQTLICKMTFFRYTCWNGDNSHKNAWRPMATLKHFHFPSFRVRHKHDCRLLVLTELVTRLGRFRGFDPSMMVNVCLILLCLYYRGHFAFIFTFTYKKEKTEKLKMEKDNSWLLSLFLIVWHCFVDDFFRRSFQGVNSITNRAFSGFFYQYSKYGIVNFAFLSPSKRIN